MPWIARKKVAFLPLFRTITAPVDGPDIIPTDWPSAILARILYHPDPARGNADGSLRAWLLAASSGRADIEPVVLPMRTIDRIDVLADQFEAELGGSLRSEGFDHACLVMLGGVGAGTNSGFWSRFVMKEHTGVWAMEMIHGISGMGDLYHLDGYSDPEIREIGRFDQMSEARLSHPTAFSKRMLGWLDPSAIASADDPVNAFDLQSVGFTQPAILGRVSAIQVGTEVPYLMIEAREMNDQFEAGVWGTIDPRFTPGIPANGVIVYRVQTAAANAAAQGNLLPLFLHTQAPLTPGQSAVFDGVTITVTGQLVGGYSVQVDRTDLRLSGQLLSYGDAGTPGNVSSPVTVGFGGWQDFKFLLAGRNAAGEDRIYAVNQGGELLSYGDAGTPGNVSSPVTVGFGSWQDFKFLFAGRNAAGEDRIYAVNQGGELLSYGDAGTPGNVSSPVTVGFGGWQDFKFLFAGRNAAGEDRIYAVNQGGELLSYGDAGTPGNVSSPVTVGFGSWQDFKFLFAGRNAAGEDRIYAVNQGGELLSYGDAGTPGNVSSPVTVGFGGWQDFKFLFAGRNAAGEDRIYSVVA
ncbi:hypothetical protein EHS39_34955 [Ensifer sp. MPMI2T]|nr:hypothetical protein EHS39_34955 [Ensifer sp. MPMI2T]